MKTSDSTFELVQSLNKNEKRFFQLRSGEKNANYMRLFKAMGQMSDFDPKKLKRLFNGEKINLPYEKNRKSTRLNSSHHSISYAVFCLKKKKNHLLQTRQTADHELRVADSVEGTSP